MVVQGLQNLPAIDVDSVLFLDNGKRAMGKIFDVFGPIQEPCYVVRFNSKEHIQERQINEGDKVYFAPQLDYTSYVIMETLLRYL